MKFETDDIALVEKLQQCNEQAFNLLYRKYAGLVFSFGMKYLRSKEDAEELTQAVFLKIWENCRNLKTNTSLKSYIFTIAYNDICKLFRKRSYMRKFLSGKLPEIQEQDSQTEEYINAGQLLNLVMQVIRKLPEKQMMAFVKSRIEGKSSREIAEEMNLSPGTVDNYISEALKLVRSKLKSKDLALPVLLSLFFL